MQFFMKLNRILTMILSLFCFSAFSQDKLNAPKERRIQGLIADSVKMIALEGATVEFYSDLDTFKAVNGKYGFVMEKIRSSEFTLVVSHVGYKTRVLKYYFNHGTEFLELPYINLIKDTQTLDTVRIDQTRKGPHINGDTTTFWANNYKVRDFATLKELVNKLEGVTLDDEGNLMYNGKLVKKALLNNSTYFQGSVKEALQEIPVHIINKIQFIEQNENGEKQLLSEESSTHINIVTKEDKSAGKMLNMSLQYGNNRRTNIEGSLRQIDGANQSSIQFGFEQNPTGIRQTNVPGTISEGGNYHILDQGIQPTDGRSKKWQATLNKSIRFNTFELSPSYTFRKNQSYTNTRNESQFFIQQDTLNESNDRQNDRTEQIHNILGRFSNSWENGGNLTGNYNLRSIQYSQFLSSTIQRIGASNGLQLEQTRYKGTTLEYDVSSVYTKNFGSSWALNLGIGSLLNDDKGNGTSTTEVFAGLLDSEYQSDSVSYQMRTPHIQRTRNYIDSKLTWKKSERFKVQVNLKVNSASDLNDIRSYDSLEVMDTRWSNYTKKSLLSIPLSITPEFNFYRYFYISPSIGFEPNILSGNLNEGTDHIRRDDFLWEPSLILGFRDQKLGTSQIGYRQQRGQPTLEQLNPNLYYLNPYYLQQGNPDLHNVRKDNYFLTYNKYFLKLGTNLSFQYRFTDIKTNVAVDRKLEIDPVKNIVKNTIFYQNLKGGNVRDLGLNLSKSITEVNAKVNFSSNFTQNYAPYLYDGKLEERHVSIDNLKLGIQYNPIMWMELNPSFSYQAYRDKNSLYLTKETVFNDISSYDANVSFFLGANWKINTILSYLKQSNTDERNNRNPIIVNANIEKRIFRDNSGIISLVIMDMTKQNYLSGFSSTEIGYTNRISNHNSRYFLLQFSWRPQLWSKSKNDSGQGRRGDGSFIVE